MNRRLLLFVAVAAMGTRHAGAAVAEDFLQQRWYRLEMMIFEQNPALAVREGFSEDGVAARERLLETVRYPNRAFALAEAPGTPAGAVAFGPPPTADEDLPLVIANLVPPAWYAPCAAESWNPPIPRRVHPSGTSAPTPPDPCLPPDPWQVEREGLEQGMHQTVPGPAPEQPDPTVVPDGASRDPETDIRGEAWAALTQAFSEYEAELMRTSYVWRRSTPLFAAERTTLARHYNLIAAGSWHQPVPPRSEPLPLVVQVGTRDDARRFPLEGWLSVTLGRYVHLHVVLEYRLPDGRIALVAEQRRMRTDEPHYLDHPAIGILARVDPVPLPETLGLLLDELEEIEE